MMSDTTLAPSSILCNIAHSVNGRVRMRTLQFDVLGGFATRGIVRRKYSSMLQFQKDAPTTVRTNGTILISGLRSPSSVCP